MPTPNHSRQTEDPSESDPVAPPGGNPPETTSAADAARMLGSLRREMNRLQREIRLAIQAQLSQMTGLSMGTLEANRELVNSIHEMLDAHGLRVRCTQCGHPAILRVSPRAGAPAGVFVFDHTIDGRRTFHGGRTTLPELHLVAKPRRKPRRVQAAKPA
ncbi:MAG: hypothetical protein AAF802_29785 [Planctomycetota bacterium]